MAVHKRADTQSSFDRMVDDAPPAKRPGKRWPFGKLLLVAAALVVWIGLIAVVDALV